MSEGLSAHEIFERNRREHEELRESLATLHRVLTERKEPVMRVGEMFANLAQQIQTHFREEEEGEGLFDQSVARQPRLAGRADALRDDHLKLTEQVRKLSEHAHHDQDQPDWWQRLADEFQQFSKDLMHHEHQENELVQDAYIQDIGSKD